MQRPQAIDNSAQSVPDRGAESSAPRSTPLTLVAGAVAGGDLQSVATAVAEALGCLVVIALPTLGELAVHPRGTLSVEATQAIVAHAAAIIRGQDVRAPEPVAEAVAVRIGHQTVGIVVVAAAGGGSSPAQPTAEQRAWLEAAAAAASVTALIRENHEGAPPGSSEALLTELAAGLPEDLPGFLGRARRLGSELGAGAVAICARRHDLVSGRSTDLVDADRQLVGELRAATGALIAELGAGQIVAITPIAAGGGPDRARELVATLRARGMTIAVSAPRRDPALLHQAVREAVLLAHLGAEADASPAGQDETFRLLIGVLLRDRGELELLRDRTISPLAEYDVRHDTDLLATLRAFLAHDGSTTETAEAMKLHRHTVGYRLSRVHEVSGLSPYESDGRERLSLGIKALAILDADQRLQGGTP